MFSRSFTKDRAGKVAKSTKKSFGSHAKRQLLETLSSQQYQQQAAASAMNLDPPTSSSPIVTVVVGSDQRLFAAHEDILCRSPYFAQACRDQFYETNGKRIYLPGEVAETFSCVLEYLYKGDYYPRIYRDKRHSHWYLEDDKDDPLLEKYGGRGASSEPTIYYPTVGNYILRDTAVYCAAERYGGLDELKRLALRKQGLQTGVDVGTVLRSARYAYDNTPDNDSRLRAHYLALIIRSRKTFKRSGTMQAEMAMGGKMFFDLFVAMCNHVDDISTSTFGTPKTI